MALRVLFYEILHDQGLLEEVPPWYSPVMPKPEYRSEQVEAWWDVPVYADHQEVRGQPCRREDCGSCKQESADLRDELPLD